MLKGMTQFVRTFLRDRVDLCVSGVAAVGLQTRAGAELRGVAVVVHDLFDHGLRDLRHVAHRPVRLAEFVEYLELDLVESCLHALFVQEDACVAVGTVEQVVGPVATDGVRGDGLSGGRTRDDRRTRDGQRDRQQHASPAVSCHRGGVGLSPRCLSVCPPHGRWLSRCHDARCDYEL